MDDIDLPKLDELISLERQTSRFLSYGVYLKLGGGLRDRSVVLGKLVS